VSDPIDAVGSLGGDMAARVRDAQSQDAALEAALGAPIGATAQPTLPRAALPAASAPLDLKGLYGQFSEGLSHGFYAPDIERLWQKIEAGKSSGTKMDMGELTAELLNVQAKIGVADACAKISTKLVEGLQSLVVRQS
jgi:hypothetical protein